MKIVIKYSNRRVSIKCKEMLGMRRGIGLMMKSRNTDNLLFRFNPADRTSITSFFVFFPFVAVWLDDRMKVIEKRIVFPFSLSLRPKKNSSFLLELPINEKNLETFRKIRFSVGKERFK